jgi:two-component system, LytTR family, sensor kinase
MRIQITALYEGKPRILIPNSGHGAFFARFDTFMPQFGLSFLIFGMKRLLRHALFWIVVVLWTTVVYAERENSYWTFLRFNLIRLPLLMAATYTATHGLLPLLWRAKPEVLHFVASLGILLTATTLIDRQLIGSQLIDDVLADLDLDYAFFNAIPLTRNLFLLIAVIGLASSLRFYKIQRATAESRAALQQEQLATELALLKARVNPHFLFNTLNNLYHVAEQQKATDLANCLHDLAGIMRYLTYDSNAPQVALSREIELIRQFIGLQSLRLGDDDDTTIAFKVAGDPGAQTLAPALLLPLVENAFKHGIAPGRFNTVDINLVVDARQLLFSIKNTVPAQTVDRNADKGAGLENLRRRLTLLYPGRHRLETRQEDNRYIASLEIARTT